MALERVPDQRSALDWLAYENRERIEAIMRPVHGDDAPLWMRRYGCGGAG